GLLGPNGAGKSTLIKLISGVYQPDAGAFLWRGQPIRFASPSKSLEAGIATIHQELEYFGQLSVAENMLMGERWPRKSWGGVDWRALQTIAADRLANFELDLAPSRLFDRITAAEKQEVAIATALSRDANLLILDEPTASLTEPEVQRLFTHLRRLREQGVAMIYVSHRMDEITTLTDRVAVLRDGELIATHRTSDVNVGQLIHDMIGRPLEQVYPKTRSETVGEPVLELEQLTRSGLFEDISLQVRAGEIVGLGGLVGAGRSELARAIYGLYSSDSGGMQLLGQPWRPRSAHQALKNGLVYLPEERKRQGLVLEHSLRDTVSIGFSDRLTRWGILSRRKEQTTVAEILKSYDVRAASAEQAIGTLSGGNQQKALLGRWLARDPTVIILDEPTRGVDVGAKAQIHATIDRLAAQGKGILLISSDLPELIGMSDRILVMNRGRIEAELSGDSR
ncbi:MAG: sugar ABC transporter ATP-binding protein, partial [Planctomycetaceae bacterium]|nr:sugar ABC transporter ATP-binding protein [Planctomycetaceae bacterium]